MQNIWEIEERLTAAELQENLFTLNQEYQGRQALHQKSGDVYTIREFAVSYTSVASPTIPYTQSAGEFFDGRFQISDN